MQLITYRNRCQEQWNWEVWRLDKAVRGARSCGGGCQKAPATPSPSHVLGGPGDPMLPKQHLSTPARENAWRGGIGGLRVTGTYRRMGWGCGYQFWVMGEVLPGLPCQHPRKGCHGPHRARLRPVPCIGTARSLLSAGKASRSPGGVSRPPCLAQATARSPSLPDAALAPAGIQQPSPAGAPRCLPITHERCRADSSGDGKELQETLMGPRLPSAVTSCPRRPQRPPHR